MNSRVEKLIDDAGLTAVLEMFEGELIEFAESIVQECASMARVYRADEYDFTGDLELDEFMLQHFGIES